MLLFFYAFYIIIFLAGYPNKKVLFPVSTITSIQNSVPSITKYQEKNS